MVKYIHQLLMTERRCPMLQIPKLTEQISPKTMKVWRIRHFLLASLKLIILISLLYFSHKFYWEKWIRLSLYIILGSIIIKAIYKLTIYPILLHKTWRFQINKHVIQTKHGFFHTQHTIIPMAHVINVQTYDDPILRKCGLVTMTIKTLTSSIHIPGLLKTEAVYIRKRILERIPVHKQWKIDDSHG